MLCRNLLVEAEVYTTYSVVKSKEKEFNCHVLKEDRQMIRRSVADMLRRARVCVERNGGHVEN